MVKHCWNAAHVRSKVEGNYKTTDTYTSFFLCSLLIISSVFQAYTWKGKGRGKLKRLYFNIQSTSTFDRRSESGRIHYCHAYNFSIITANKILQEESNIPQQENLSMVFTSWNLWWFNNTTKITTNTHKEILVEKNEFLVNSLKQLTSSLETTKENLKMLTQQLT